MAAALAAADVQAQTGGPLAPSNSSLPIRRADQPMSSRDSFSHACKSGSRRR